MALRSVLIVSTVLLGLTTTVASTGFFSRGNSLNTESKRVSLGLAESCMNAALLELSKNDMYLDASVDPDGADIDVNGDTCHINAITHPAYDGTHRKTLNLTTNAGYPDENGSFSEVQSTITMLDPDAPLVDAAGACVLQASPSPILIGKPITIQWSSSSNVTSFSVSPTLSPSINNPSEAESGSRTYTAPMSAGDITFVGTASPATGPSGQCTATVTVQTPPPTPSCADTVMMLDRTGSMADSYPCLGCLGDEKDAADGLLDLYAGINNGPLPYVAVGVFGAIGQGSPYYANLMQGLTNDYNLDYTAVANGLANASGGTNLKSAIEIAQTELVNNGTVQQNGQDSERVIILVSDGMATHPSPVATAESGASNAAQNARDNGTKIFTIHFGGASGMTYLASLATDSDNDQYTNTSTGNKNPSATHSPSNWTNGGNAQVNDSAYATNATANAQQAYSSFNLNSVPSGSTITGIEVTAAAKTGATTNLTLAPTAVGNYNSTWSGFPTNTNIGKVSAVGTGDNDTSYIVRQNGAITDAQTFIVTNASVPPGAIITSVTVNTVARNSAGTSQFRIRVEKGTGVGLQNDGAVIAPTSSYVSYPRVMPLNPFTSAVWTTADINAMRFGVVKANTTGTLRVTQINVIVSYFLPGGNCALNADLSWDNGGTYTSSKSISVNATEPASPGTGVGGSGDDWGHSWTTTQLANSGSNTFVLRLTNTNCTGANAVNLNYVTAKVYYNGYDADAENDDGDNFFIAPQSDDLESIFTTIGKLVCPAAAPACSNKSDDDGDAFKDDDDPGCHTDGNASNAASYDPDGNDEWSVPGVPPPPVPPPPPPPITIGPWQQN